MDLKELAERLWMLQPGETVCIGVVQPHGSFAEPVPPLKFELTRRKRGEQAPTYGAVLSPKTRRASVKVVEQMLDDVLPRSTRRDARGHDVIEEPEP